MLLKVASFKTRHFIQGEENYDDIFANRDSFK